ncbi:MAG: hypothetical protein BWK80_15185 [Desulfobacteraceae bacterium IS3]|nr:MAG: hypothetical protein BWK80_15185 [Desulfobacteraceae bacterium IS3]
MLNSYKAIYRHGMLQWIDDMPDGDNLHVIITVLEKEKTAEPEEFIENIMKRSRGVIKPGKSKDEIDEDITAMRAEWKREWD